MATKTDDQDFERPLLVVDVVMFTVMNDKLHVLLPQRDKAPFEGVPGLVGGVIHTNEDKDTHGAARRVALQKINMDVSHLEQLAMFSGPDRDPRGWSASMAYLAMVKSSTLSFQLVRDFYPIDALPEKMAFDHKIIVNAAISRLRNKSSYSTLPLFLMEDAFTLGELQKIYETLMGESIDKSWFRKLILDLNIVEPTGEMSDPKKTKTRPAPLFRAIDQKIWFFKGLS